MSLIRKSKHFYRSQTIAPIAHRSAPTARIHSRALPNGWWIIPMATLGMVMWYWIITGLFALIG